MPIRPPPPRKSPIPAPRKSPIPVIGARGERLDVQAMKRQASSSVHVSRKDGRTLKRMTLYLPADLAKRLAVHCAEQEIDMSAVVTEAVRRHLLGGGG